MNISNYTNESATEDQAASKRYMVAGEILLIVIATVTVYIFLSLQLFNWRMRQVVGVSGSKVEKREKYLRYMCSFSILIAIIRCALHQGVVFISGSDYLTTCRNLLTASQVVYNIAMGLIYVYFWLRQRNFNDRFIDLKHGKCYKVLDWAVLVLTILVSGVMAIIAYLPYISNKTTVATECRVFRSNDKTIVLIYAGLALLFQVSLWILYYYPFMHLRQQKKFSEGNVQISFGKYEGIYTDIRRSLILLSACIFVNIATTTTASRLTKYYPNLFVTILAFYDVNLITNVICAICTFRNWRKIIFGFPVLKRLVDTRDVIIDYKQRGNSIKRTSKEKEIQVTLKNSEIV